MPTFLTKPECERCGEAAAYVLENPVGLDIGACLFHALWVDDGELPDGWHIRKLPKLGENHE